MTMTRGRPRSVAVDLAIAQATSDLLVAHGYGGLTMAAVASEAGVSTATLYRRFQNKEDLVATAVAELREEELFPDTGSLAGDVRTILERMANRLRSDGGLLAAVLGESVHNPALAEALRGRFDDDYRAGLSAMLDRAVARGELAEPGDVALAASLLMGPLHSRWLFSGEPITDDFVDQLAPRISAALAHSPAATPTPVPTTRR
jgi:AcrR family transcriptional regulator